MILEVGMNNSVKVFFWWDYGEVMWGFLGLIYIKIRELNL